MINIFIIFTEEGANRPDCYTYPLSLKILVGTLIYVHSSQKTKGYPKKERTHYNLNIVM